jgi:ferredoxin
MEQNRRTAAIFFSPTETSKKGVLAMAQALTDTPEIYDVTLPPKAPAQAALTAADFAVFGAPVYAGRIFRGALERMDGIRGDQTPCIVTVTYGNRDYDDALLELCDFVRAHGFVVVGAAALIGEHTYGEIQKGRPNEEDLAADLLFAQQIRYKEEAGQYLPAEVPGQRPYIHGEEGGKGGRFHPLTSDACVQCGLCAAVCPQGAIDPQNCKKMDENKCIACFRCIRKCPKGAKNMNVEPYLTFAKEFTAKLAQRKENRYFR